MIGTYRLSQTYSMMTQSFALKIQYVELYFELAVELKDVNAYFIQFLKSLLFFNSTILRVSMTAESIVKGI